MKSRIWIYIVLFCGLTLGLILIPGLAEADEVPKDNEPADIADITGTADASAADGDHGMNHEIPNVIHSFDQLTHQGDWLGFHPGDTPHAKNICTCKNIPNFPISTVDACMPTCEFYLDDCCPTREQHYQGIARAQRSSGPPLIFLSRAGKPTSAREPSEGAIWVAAMWSRDKDGERLRSNRLDPQRETHHSMPPAVDRVINYYEFTDQKEFGVNEWGIPKFEHWTLDYNHPGGIQIVDDILAVSLMYPNQPECYKEWEPPFHCTQYPSHPDCEPQPTPEPPNCLPKGKIAFFDVSDPNNFKYLGDFGLYFYDHGADAVAITKLPEPDGRYLVAVYGNGALGASLTFFESNLADIEDPNFQFTKKNQLDQGILDHLDEQGYWRFDPEPQSLNFVNEVGGDLYLIGAVNNSSWAPIIDPFGNNDNIMYLWQVMKPDPSHPWLDRYGLKGVRKGTVKKLTSEGFRFWKADECYLIKNSLFRQEGNFSAGGGAYVTPTGELLYYATAYWNLGQSPPGSDTRINRLAELRNDKIATNGTCGPQFRDNHLGGPHIIYERDELSLHGNTYIIWPWVQMNAHHMTWRSVKDESVDPPKLLYYEKGNWGATFTLDWQDQSFDSWFDFKVLDGHDEHSDVDIQDDCNEGTGGKDGFDECMTSFTFCGLEGSTLEIFDDDAGELGDVDFEQAKNGNSGWISCQGTGQITRVKSFLYEQPEECTHHIGSDKNKNWYDFNDEATAARITWPNKPQNTHTWSVIGPGSIEKRPVPGVAKYTAASGAYLDRVVLDVLGEETSAKIVVLNVPPEIDYLSSNSSTPEGHTHTLKMRWKDKGASNVMITVDWGDTSHGTNQISNGADMGAHFEGRESFTHVYADNGNYEINVCVNDFEDTVCQTKTVEVTNVSPTVQAGEDQVIYEGDVLYLDPAKFHDMGTLDSHTSTVRWGDKLESDIGLVTETPYGPPGSTDGLWGTVDASHQYLALPGEYTLEVCVTDDDGASGCDTLNVTVVHGFMRFCAYGDGQRLDDDDGMGLLSGLFNQDIEDDDDDGGALIVYSKAAADCPAVLSGTAGGSGPSGIGARGQVHIKKEANVTGFVQSLSQQISVGQAGTIQGPISGGHNVRIEKNAQIMDSITSGYRVYIKRGALVEGDITARNRVKVDRRATVNGDISPYTAVPDIPGITWVNFNVDPGRKNVTIPRGTSQYLPPGEYRDLKVRRGATLTLRIGRYSFRNFKVERGGRIEFILSHYPYTVQINIAKQLDLAKDVQMVLLEGEVQNILFRIAARNNDDDDDDDSYGDIEDDDDGGAAVNLGSDGVYLGTFLAPNSHIKLGDDATLEGALYAKQVKIGNRSQISGNPARDLFIDTFITP